MIFENIRTIELNDGLLVENGCTIMAMGDSYAHKFGADITRNGASVSTQGMSVLGYFVRPDGTTIAIEGTASGNRVEVELTPDCYYYPGHFRFSIQVTDNGATTTVRMIDGVVALTQSGEILDNGVVYSLDALKEEINGKMNKPEDDGTNGFVLTTDGEGNVSWQDISAGTVAGTVQVDGSPFTIRTGTSGASGYLTFVLEG